jgi:hypothetical protein
MHIHTPVRSMQKFLANCETPFLGRNFTIPQNKVFWEILGWRNWGNCHHYSQKPNLPIPSLFRMSQEERSIFWEVILSKKVYMYMCPIPNGFRDRAISLYSTLYTVQTSNTPWPHTSCKVRWCCRWNIRKYIILSKLQKYYFSAQYQSSCFHLKHLPVSISKHNVSETGFCLRLQVKPISWDSD